MTQRVADAVRSVPTIVINDTYRLAPWAALLYAADEAWWAAHPEALAFAGLKVSVASVRGVEQLRNTGTVGFDPDPACVRTGSNSGYQALHIAVHAGASRVLLCGYDMSAKKGAHWFGPHRGGLSNTIPETYARFIRRYEELAPLLAARGVEVINCTPGSALTCFARRELTDVLKEGDATCKAA